MEKKINIEMFQTLPRIGNDESGKGDYFGGIAVTAVYLDEELEKRIRNLGIKDSKKITDKRIHVIADNLKKLVPFSTVRISAEKYNQLYEKFKNINRILGWAHATAIKNLINKVECEIVIVDKFTQKEHIQNNLKNIEKYFEIFEFINAEADLAVASASIIARQAFLHMIDKLSTETGVELPLGSTHIKEKIKEVIDKKGFDFLKKIAKFHFKTTKEFYNLTLDL